MPDNIVNENDPPVPVEELPTRSTLADFIPNDPVNTAPEQVIEEIVPEEAVPEQVPEPALKTELVPEQVPEQVLVPEPETLQEATPDPVQEQAITPQPDPVPASEPALEPVIEVIEPIPEPVIQIGPTEEEIIAEQARIDEQERLEEEVRVAEEARLAEELRVKEEIRAQVRAELEAEAAAAAQKVVEEAERTRLAQEALRIAEEVAVAEEARVEAERQRTLDAELAAAIAEQERVAAEQAQAAEAEQVRLATEAVRLEELAAAERQLDLEAAEALRVAQEVQAAAAVVLAAEQERDRLAAKDAATIQAEVDRVVAETQPTIAEAVPEEKPAEVPLTYEVFIAPKRRVPSVKELPEDALEFTSKLSKRDTARFQSQARKETQIQQARFRRIPKEPVEVALSTAETENLIESALARNHVPYLSFRVTKEEIFIDCSGNILVAGPLVNALTIPGVFGIEGIEPESALLGSKVPIEDGFGNVSRTLFILQRRFAEKIVA